MQFNNVVTVDPGWFTGLAYWIGTDEPIYKLLKVRKLKGRVIDWGDKIDSLSLQFKTFCCIYKPNTVYIEGTTVYAHSAKSMSATKNLMHLNVLVGEYRKIAKDAGATKVTILEPKEWKGQLSKEAVDKRIFRINQTLYPEHISDAVGIGFSIQGRL